MTSQASQFRLLVAVVALAALALAVSVHAGVTGYLPFRVADQDAWLDSNEPYFSSLFPSTLRGCLKYHVLKETDSWDCSLIGEGWKNQPTDVLGGLISFPSVLCYWCPSPDDLDSVYMW